MSPTMCNNLQTVQDSVKVIRPLFEAPGLKEYMETGLDLV